MESQQTPEPATVAVDDVEVVKRLDLEMFPAPTVAFDIESERSRPADLRIVESVPDNVTVDDVGFHPEYGEEQWTTEGDELVFEYRLDAEERYTTVFAIRGDETDGEPFLEEPPAVEVGSADGPNSSSLDNQIPAIEATEDRSEGVVSDGGSGEESISTIREEVATHHSDGGRSARATEPSEPPRSMVETNEIVDQLVSDLRTGAIDDERVDELREALRPREGSVDARLSRVQTEVADLRAYVDALESFLDENGTGEQLIEDFAQRLDGVEDDVETVVADVDSHGSRLDSLGETTAGIDEELAQMHEEMGDVRASLERLEAELDELDERVPDENLAPSIDEMKDDIEGLTEWQGQLEDAFSVSPSSAAESEDDATE